MKQGGVSSRVALLLRSTEPQPSLLDLSFHTGVCVCVGVCVGCVCVRVPLPWVYGDAVPLPLANGEAAPKVRRVLLDFGRSEWIGVCVGCFDWGFDHPS